MFKHPIVDLIFFFCFSISIIFHKSYYDFLPHFLILIFLLAVNNRIFFYIFSKLKILFTYFPIVLSFYIIFSLLLTANNIYLILNQAFFALFKISFTILAMSIYLKNSNINRILSSLRSLWLYLNRPWALVEHFFLFITLTLRFYPTIHMDWVKHQDAQIGLELVIKNSFFDKILNYAKEIPSFLAYQLMKSDDLVIAMHLRGYGKNTPRGVVDFIPFSLLNFFQLIIIFFLILIFL